MAKTSSNYFVAIALEDDDGALRLLATIRRAVGSDLYYLMPRANQPAGYPHSSRHASGDTHIKTAGKRLHRARAQKPDGSFTGVEDLFTETVQAGDLPRCSLPCVESDYSEVWKIKAAVFDDSKPHIVAAQLVEPGQESAPRHEWGRIVEERIFTDRAPYIRVTIWQPGPVPV